MTVCETSSEQLIRHRPDHPDRLEWLGGEAMVPVHPARPRASFLNAILSPHALVIAFLAGAVIGGSTTTLWLPLSEPLGRLGRRKGEQRKHSRRG